jgi:hypothetical protein
MWLIYPVVTSETFRMDRALTLGLLLVCLTPALPAPPAVKPTNLPFNTPADEDDPHALTERQLERVFYSSWGGKKYDILFSTWVFGRGWSKGQEVGPDVQTDVDDRSVCTWVERGGRVYLYFATKTDREVNNYDIYVAVRQGPGKPFTARTPLSTVCTEADEMHPWIAENGKALYFSRKTKEGWRVFVARRDEAAGGGGFGQPVLLKELPANYHHATLSHTGRTMYLQGPLGKDRWGIFRSERTATGWSEPEAVEELNDPRGRKGDMSPCLTHDSAFLYFASDRSEGKGGLDIYRISTGELQKRPR